MLYKKYGITDKECSVIGFGGMRFENPNDIDSSAALVYSAYQAGINYFDTAPFYCNDKSEDIFGAAIKQMKKTARQRPFYISTKTMEPEPDKIRKEAEKSLKRLGVDCVDFYHCWCIITLDQFYDRVKKGALKEFEKLKAEGLVRHICVSTHLPGGDIGKLLNEYPFEGVLLGYNVMNFAYRQAGLDAAAGLRKGVAVMNPLGGGIIPQNPDKFNFIKTQQNESVTQAAIRFLINDPAITIALIGFANNRQLDEAITAVDGFKPISQEEINRIKSRLSKQFNEFCTICTYCDKCPKKIPIYKLMESYNYKMLREDPKVLVDRIRYYWSLKLEETYADQCTECGLCEKLCTQKLPIRKRLLEIRQEIEKFHKAQAEKKPEKETDFE